MPGSDRKVRFAQLLGALRVAQGARLGVAWAGNVDYGGSIPPTTPSFLFG